MCENPIPITSDTTIEDVNVHFKVIAGPGAGKTYWLINHIRNILRNSDRLTAASKIACISYTNVAAEEITKGLSIPENTVEVSTIHSFLYKNVIKPYAYTLKDEDGRALVDAKSLKGHDEHIPKYPKIKNWVDKVTQEAGKTNGYVYIKRFTEEGEDLKKIICTINSDGECSFIIQNIGFPKLFRDKIVEYKSQYWAEGKLDHNDVLYLSNRIFEKSPGVLKFISAKYPYILLDEFQDTNPVQTKIVRELGRCGTVVGIVGDPAQSIYSFNGANREDFLNFQLDGMKVYSIEGNRRSTTNIISLLNHIRHEDKLLPSQKPVPEFGYSGRENELILSTDLEKIKGYFGQEIVRSGEESYCILARKNELVSKLRLSSHPNIWREVEQADRDRYLFLKKLILAMRYAGNRDYFRALNCIESVLLTDNKGELKSATIRGNIADIDLGIRQLAISIMRYLVASIERRDVCLKNFYDDLDNYLTKQSGIRLKGIRNGKFGPIAAKYSLDDLYQSLDFLDETSDIRTIHKAKGTEFDSILVMFEDISDIEKHLLKPDINSKTDDCRVFYVALSRARRRLFLGIQILKSIDYTKFHKMHRYLKIVNLDQATLDCYASTDVSH